jgi:hypothetical protein
MSIFTDNKPWATIMVGMLVAIAAIAGGIIVIVRPETLNFEQYLDLLKNFAIAVGILGVGRGIMAAGKSNAEATTLSTTTGPSTDEWRSGLGAGPADVTEYAPPEPVYEPQSEGDVPPQGYDHENPPEELMPGQPIEG